MSISVHELGDMSFTFEPHKDTELSSDCHAIFTSEDNFHNVMELLLQKSLLNNECYKVVNKKANYLWKSKWIPIILHCRNFFINNSKNPIDPDVVYTKPLSSFCKSFDYLDILSLGIFRAGIRLSYAQKDMANNFALSGVKICTEEDASKPEWNDSFRISRPGVKRYVQVIPKRHWS